MRVTPGISTTDTYFELVNDFPLRRIRNKSEHAPAVARLGSLALAHQQTRDAGVIDYIDMLAHLVDEYESSSRSKVSVGNVAPADLVRHLIQSNGLTIASLARQTGLGQSNLSEMLAGRRDFSKSAIAKLCKRFGLSPAVFF
jgi:HTH-type transcriptional regulator / antitoxin HigA